MSTETKQISTSHWRGSKQTSKKLLRPGATREPDTKREDKKMGDKKMVAAALLVLAFAFRLAREPRYQGLTMSQTSA